MKRITLSLLSCLLLLGAFTVVPLSASAITKADVSGGSQTDGSNDQYVDPAFSAAADCNKHQCGIIANYINPAIKLLTILVGIAVVLGIIVGAIQVIVSAGDPQRAASGKNHIRNALIALVAYVFLFALLKWLLPGGIA